MIKKIKNAVLALASLSVLLAPVATVTTAYAAADLSNTLCSGTNLDVNGTSSTNCGQTENGTTFNNLLTRIVNIFSAIVGVAAVLMLIYGGFRYITSGGDSGNVSNAKNTIIYALVGLIIVALAQTIVHFVLSKATGTA